MAQPRDPQIGRLFGLPLAGLGVLAAVLMWELDHVGSIALALVITAGAMAGAVLVARRIRARLDGVKIHYEELLRIADEQSRRAEAASRLKDEFLLTLSHELRTPLNLIVGWTRLLASGKLDADQRSKAIQAIDRAGWTQARMVDDLLDLSRATSGRLRIEPRPALLQPLITAAAHALGSAADAKGIAIEIGPDPGIGLVEVDPVRVQQIAWNLLSNAIKFTPPGGHVRIGLQRDRDVARLTVMDTGIGFGPDVGPQLFDRFRQADRGTHRQFGGLGLGLAVVRDLVELHGGTVTAESAGEQRGAVFTVVLPLVIAPGAQTTQERSTPELRGTSVLAVDDDPQTLEFVRISLERCGAVVAIASSLDEARGRLRQTFDVVISDLRMPDGDGTDVVRALREHDSRSGRTTPAIALTALARSEDRSRALAGGFDLHIVKPIDPFELGWAVQRVAHRPAELCRSRAG